MLGVVQKLLSYHRVKVKCIVWEREADFQSETRGDIVWRYTQAQSVTQEKRRTTEGN